MVDTIRHAIPLVMDLQLPYYDVTFKPKTFKVEYYTEHQNRGTAAQTYFQDVYAVPNRNYKWVRHHILNLAYMYQILEIVYKTSQLVDARLEREERGWRMFFTGGE